jgi:hypothetical protein
MRGEHFSGQIWTLVLLMHNRSGNFSVEQLMDFLVVLGQDVEITVTGTRKDTVRHRLFLLEFSGSPGGHGLTVSKVKTDPTARPRTQPDGVDIAEVIVRSTASAF